MKEPFYAEIVSKDGELTTVRWHNTEFGKIVQSVETKETLLRAFMHCMSADLEKNVPTVNAW